MNAKQNTLHNDKNPLRIIKQRRNDPCFCGSGKKAKRCCGEREMIKKPINTIE